MALLRQERLERKFSKLLKSLNQNGDSKPENHKKSVTKKLECSEISKGRLEEQNE